MVGDDIAVILIQIHLRLCLTNWKRIVNVDEWDIILIRGLIGISRYLVQGKVSILSSRNQEVVAISSVQEHIQWRMGYAQWRQMGLPARVDWYFNKQYNSFDGSQT